MRINGTDLREYGDGKYVAKQWRVTPAFRTFKNDSTWERGSPIPIFQAPTTTFKPITVVIMIKGINRDAIIQGMNEIVTSMKGVNELRLDRWQHTFCGVLTKATLKELSETSKNRFSELNLQFNGYEHGEEYSVEASGTTLIIDNPGNMISPAKIEITPSSAISSLTITGICRDSETEEELEAQISSMTSGTTVTLDGINGLITEDDSLKTDDVDIWALPSLLPGENTITFSTSVSATVTVLPIYM